MSNIVPLSNTFHYQEITVHPIRTIMKDGDPWFVAADICASLDIANVSQAVENLDEDEKGISITDTPGGKQSMLYVSLPGLYKLTFRSNKPEAKAFTRWVTHEVLPAILKTGSYSFSGQKLLQPTSPRYELTTEDEETLILRYVERLENPTARDLGRYLTRYHVHEIRLQLHDLAEQGKLHEWFTGHSFRYKVK